SLLLHELRERVRVRIGEVVRELRVVDRDDVDAVLRELVRERVDALTEDDPDALPAHEPGELLSRGETRERGLRELPVLMLRDDEDVAHDQITFASLCSTCTSSWTEATFRPPVRFGGVSSFTIFTFGATSTPRSATEISFSSFFRAFMIPGSDA